MDTTSYSATPNLLLLLLLGLAFVLGLMFRFLMRGQARPHPDNSTSVVWVATVAGLGLFVMLGYAFTSVGMVRSGASPFEPTAPGSDVAPKPSSTSVVSGAAEAPLPLPRSAASTEEATAFDRITRSVSQVERPVWFGIASLLALLAGITLVWHKSTRSKPVTPPGTTTMKSGLGWMIVPIVCLVGLVALVAPRMISETRPAIWTQPAISTSQREKMDKAVRDLSEVSSGPGAEVQNIPDWIRQQSQRKDQYLLSSGQYSTRQEAEDELLPIAADLLQRAFHENHPWQGEWNVPLAQVRERVADQQFVERRNVSSGSKTFEMYRLHMLVNVTPEVCETFTESWKSQIVERRLKLFGVLLAWLSCVLLLGSVYYRSLAIPGAAQHWGGAIKVSVLTIVVTAVAAWVLLAFVH